MYEIHIESSEFKGKRTVQQHQLVNQVNPYNNNVYFYDDSLNLGGRVY